MIPIIYFLASVLVWLAIFLFAKLNWGITSASTLATTIVALGIVAVFLGLNSLRLAFKSNMGVLAVVVLLSVSSLFAIDYFMADFAISSVSTGIVLSLVIVLIFLGSAFLRKAILGDRGQL